MLGDIEKELLSAEEISKKVAELGRLISADYKGKTPVLVAVLKGSVVFISDLMRSMDIPVSLDFMSVSSYGSGVKTTGVVKILKDLDMPIEGRDIILVEDILDSGRTLSYLREIIQQRNPASVRIVTLLDKPGRREAQIKADYCGFEIDDVFVVGYGLDYSEKYRNLPFVGVLRPEVYR